MKARPFSLLLVLALGGLLLVGCSAANDSTASGGSLAEGKNAAPAAVPAAAGKDMIARTAAEPVAGANLPTAATAATRLVRTAQITVEVSTLSAAADSVRKTATAFGGLVSAETTTFPPGTLHGTNHPTPPAPSGVRPQSVLTLRVPEPRLDDALTQVSAVGHELSRTTSSQDVTGTIADLNSRVSTQTRSVTRIRDLMNRATSLKDVVLLESELSTREADLEALEARQRALSDEADLATLTVTLRTPVPVAATPKSASHIGFLTGLRGGWNALAATVVVVLTVLGAVLPIGLALAVLAVPSYLGYRIWRRRNQPDPVTSPAPSAPASPTS